MFDDQRPGTVYWIDHYVVPTNDVDRWIDFHEKILGAKLIRFSEERKQIGLFQDLTQSHHGGFVQKEPLPATRGLGRDCPRYGFFVRAEDIDEHLRRLDQHQVPHTNPVRTSAEGEEGTVVYWQDPDGNQFEFWAPDRLPAGALDGCGPLEVGRISHGIFESRDLDRTASFFDRYAALEPARNADIATGTLVLPLAAGGRLIFKKAEDISPRAGARGWRGSHAALTVRDEDYFPNSYRMWDELPEWDYDERQSARPGDPGSLPARTALHGSPAGRKWKEVYGRGDDWYDWDANCFHFYGGVPRGETMAIYEGRSMEYHLQEYLESRGEKATFRAE